MKKILITFLLLISATAVNAHAAIEACVTNRNAPPVSAYYWPPDTHVKVFLVRNMFTSAQRNTLLASMSDWSTAAAETGTGIKFTYEGETEGLMNCTGCLTLTRREVYRNDKKHYAFFNPLLQDSNGLLISAWIDFDFAITDPQALQGFMSHELGHGMGLWDCTTCKKKKTIMNAFPRINKDNGLMAPSTCDLEVIRQVYQFQRRLENTVADGGSNL